jgi:glucose/arabinose dehydrogenase/mono/diheme cytochrome c family protein
MRSPNFLRHCAWFAAMLAPLSLAAPAANAEAPPAAKSTCANDDSGLTLPPGFCATVFADGIGHARHMVVAPNGVLYVNTWSGRYYGNDTPHAGGFLVALKDTAGSGTANLIERFGETVQSGGAGGTGIGYYQGAIFAESNDKILRYTLSTDSMVPGSADTVVSGLPLTGDHPMHPFAIEDGSLYIDVATATNSCQHENRTLKSPGMEPCTELLTRGGIWRYDATKTNQVFSPAERYATGIRNAEGYGVDTAGHHLYFTQHGRDQLHMNWPDLYKADQEATLPSEELLLLTDHGDYGWPRCYFDPFRHKLVLAPEYGGDGGKKVGLCAKKIAPIAVFPAHWAPNGMVFYDQSQFPERYRNGVFIAFHGSWDRSPYAQSGYNVVFQGLSDGEASGKCEIFADGFAGSVRSPDQAAHRPDGLAVGPDGALYVSDDVRGRIYRIVYRGGSEAGAASSKPTPCPSLTAPPHKPLTAAANQGAGAGAPPDAASLPLPNAATREMVLLGDRVYHGEVGGASCAGCHGLNGSGTALGPNLTDSEWLWSDGSYRGISMTIRSGVMQPKQYRAAMPPMGGAQLTPEQVSAVAAYVWGLSHR